MADTYRFNIFTGTLDVVSGSGGGGGGGATYSVDTFTLSGTNITNKFVTLSATPTTTSDTVLNIIGGVVQDYGVDFTVSGTTLSWNGLWLDGVLEIGDKLIVQFN